MLQERLAPLSTSVAAMVPVAVGVPATGVPSSALPASTTVPAITEAPITGASLVPVSFTVSVAMLSVPLPKRMV